MRRATDALVSWLISEGQHCFERVLETPDVLSEYRAREVGQQLSDYSYIAVALLEAEGIEATGPDACVDESAAPLSLADAERVLPRLLARFGATFRS